MSSSSSDDDCYSITAKKLQDIKSGWNAGHHVDFNKDETPDLSPDSPIKTINPLTKKLSALPKAAKTRRKSTRLSKKLTKTSSETLAVDPMKNNSLAGDSPIVTQKSTRSSSKASRKRGKSRTAPQVPAAAVYLVPSPATGLRHRTRSRGRNRTPRNLRQQTINRNVISIGSDGEDCGLPLFAKPSNKNCVVDLESSGGFDSSIISNSDAENYNEELSLKIYWRSNEYHKFNIRKYQKLTTIFEFFAKLENVSEDCLLFTLNDRILRPQDTPESINYNICQFIDGGIVPHSVAEIAAHSSEKHISEVRAPDCKMLNLKVRTKDMKTPFEIAVSPNQKMSFLMMKFSEEIEIPLSKLKFYFDGDLLAGNVSIKEADLEGGECIDVNII